MFVFCISDNSWLAELEISGRIHIDFQPIVPITEFVAILTIGHLKLCLWVVFWTVHLIILIVAHEHCILFCTRIPITFANVWVLKYFLFKLFYSFLEFSIDALIVFHVLLHLFFLLPSEVELILNNSEFIKLSLLRLWQKCTYSATLFIRLMLVSFKKATWFCDSSSESYN